MNDDNGDDAAAQFEKIAADFANLDRRRLTASQRRLLHEQSLLMPRPGETAFAQPPPRLNGRMAIYERISKTNERSVSLARQYDECMTYIKSVGGTIDQSRDLFQDRVSAAGGKLRLGMETLLKAVESGRYDGIVVWELPRALRNKLESFKFRDVMMRAGCDLHVVCVPSLSLYGPTSILFDTLVDVAVAEIGLMRERAVSYHSHVRPQGAAIGIAVFGMRASVSDRLIPGRSAPVKRLQPDVEPREELGGLSRADLVRQAADALLAGRSQRSIAMEWNRLGFPARSGGPWYQSTVKNMLGSPALAGLGHRGRVLLDTNLQEVPAGRERDVELLVVGEPLLDLDTWLQVQSVLAARRVVKRSYTESLLSALIMCGACGYRVAAHGAAYACQRNYRIGSGCAGNAVVSTAIEREVVQAVLHVLADPDRRLRADSALAPGRRERIASLEADRSRLTRRLDDLEEMWLDSDGRDADAKRRFQSRRTKVVDELTQLSAEIGALRDMASSRTVAALEAAADVPAAWAALPVHRRNSVLHELIEDVVLHPVPSGKKGGRFEPERVEIIWATD